ncbi:MAG: enoyl-CoA hydratase-related protein [Elusimicrobiota bacterium]
MEHIKLEIGAVSRVVLNRPGVRNAMSGQTLRELAEAFRRIASNEAVRVVVVMGEGQDFCAGADIEWMRQSGQLPAEEGKKDARLLAEMLSAVDECPVPVVVGAHGHVFGGGLGLVAACDIALLVDGAQLSFSECRLAIVPAVISNWVLPKIGAANARRYYLTAEVFEAKEAVAMGLASEVVAGSELDARIDALCRDILKNGPEAVRAAKALIARMPGKTLEEGVNLAVETLVRLRSSPEGQEGLAAFLERRVPKWTVKA